MNAKEFQEECLWYEHHGWQMVECQPFSKYAKYRKHTGEIKIIGKKQEI